MLFTCSFIKVHIDRLDLRRAKTLIANGYVDLAWVKFMANSFFKLQLVEIVVVFPLNYTFLEIKNASGPM